MAQPNPNVRRNKRRRIEVPTVPSGVGGEGFGAFFEVPARLRSRVLYANPVCILVSSGVRPLPAVVSSVEDTTEPTTPTATPTPTPTTNAMTISWLSCIDNNGLFFASMNEQRFTASLLGFANSYEGARFTLNVPTQGCEPLVRRIGGESGLEVNKLEDLALGVCNAGGGGGDVPLPCLDHPLVVAHLECEVLSGSLSHKHHMLTCRILSAHVRKAFWSGETFKPTAPTLPSYLTFFGGGQFGVAQPVERLSAEEKLSLEIQKEVKVEKTEEKTEPEAGSTA